MSDQINMDSVEFLREMPIYHLARHAHEQASDAGWHDEPREVGTQLMLIVSEVAEAMEAARKDLNDDKLPHRKGIEVELADAVIRIFDLSGALDLDIAGAIAEKLEYNRTRIDHTREHRSASGGKKW